jgi:hypothetical protein
VLLLQDEAVTADEQIQAWARDLADEGAVHGMPQSIATIDQLAQVVATVLFICGPQHSAVNYTQVRGNGPAGTGPAVYALLASRSAVRRTCLPNTSK